MLEEKALRALMDYRGDETPVVSLYLNVDMTRRTKDEAMLVLRGLLKKASSKASKADLKRIEDYFSLEYDWQAKGVAAFSCKEKGLWQAYPLAVPVQDGVYVMPKPYIQPLATLMALYERYGIALVSREQARFFLLHMGEISEYEGVLSEIPGRHKQGGWAQARYQRHIDERAAQQIRSAAEAFAELCKTEKWNHIILAGTEENVTLFEEALPSHLQELVIGSFASDMTASTKEIKEEAMNLIRKFEREQADSLVEEAITKAAKGKGATTGVDDTVNAIAQGRVQVLLVLPDYHVPGRVCDNCGYMTTQPINTCPYCFSDLRELPDIVERAVEQTLKANGKVIVVQDGKKLREAGSIAALLRY